MTTKQGFPTRPQHGSPFTVPSRPPLLFLGHCLPYPPDSGVTNRTFNILKQLQVEFDIHLLAFSRVCHQPDAAARQAAQAALREIASAPCDAVPIPAEHSVVRRAWDHLRSVISGRAYTFYEYSSRQFGSHLQTVLSGATPSLIHLDSLDLYRWLPGLPQGPIVCTHHSIESELLRLRARWVKSVVLRRYLLHQAALVERAEREFCPKLSLNVMTSDLDAARLQRLAPGAVTSVAPNGVDTHFFRPANAGVSVVGRVVFLGPTYVVPNRDAVDFLVADIWPRIRAVQPGASLRLIGRAPASDRARYEEVRGVTTLGHVPDIRPHLAEARCCVVPIRIGGGTRLKILDSWAMGKAVVSSSIGCEGLEAVDGENILIRDEPEAFAKAVVRVLSDEALRSRLERNSRTTAEEIYSWDVVGRRLRAAYRSLLDGV